MFIVMRTWEHSSSKWDGEEWATKTNRCFPLSNRKHLCPRYTLLYVIFTPGKRCKCSHICQSLYKKPMHHLLREPPVAESSPPSVLPPLIHAQGENRQIGPLAPVSRPSVSVCVGSRVCGRLSLFTWGRETLRAWNMCIAVVCACVCIRMNMLSVLHNVCVSVLLYAGAWKLWQNLQA